jgi:hypothetical protein
MGEQASRICTKEYKLRVISYWYLLAEHDQLSDDDDDDHNNNNNNNNNIAFCPKQVGAEHNQLSEI